MLCIKNQNTASRTKKSVSGRISYTQRSMIWIREKPAPSDALLAVFLLYDM